MLQMSVGIWGCNVIRIKISGELFLTFQQFSFILIDIAKALGRLRASLFFYKMMTDRRL